MRTITAAFKTEQIDSSLVPRYRITLTRSGQTTVIYTQTRIISIEHQEEPYSAIAEVVLNNSDLAVTTDFKGYQGVIEYGMVVSGVDTYPTTAPAPLFVVGQQSHSSQGVLSVTLSLVGLADLLAQDKANAQSLMSNDDLQTPKDVLTQVIKAVLPARANSTAYALDDLVRPATSNDFTYKCTVAGTSAAAPPVFPTTIGGTVADGTVTWTNQGKELKAFSHCPAYTPTFDSEDNLLDTVIPADTFQIELNDTRLDAIRRLLFYTRVVMRVEDDGEIHFRAPTVDGDTWVALTAYTVNEYAEPTVVNNTFAFRCTTAGTSAATEPTWPTVAGNTVTDGTVVWTAVDFDYEYRVNVAAQHEIFGKATRNRLVMPNFIVVKSPPDSGDLFEGTAEFTDSSDLPNMEKREHYYINVANNTEAINIAKAILWTYRLGAQNGACSAPLNVAQEIHDYVKFTDSRQSDVRTGNVGTLKRVVGQGVWLIHIALGETDLGGFLGLLLPEAYTIIELLRGPQAAALARLQQLVEESLAGRSNAPSTAPAPVTTPSTGPTISDAMRRREEQLRGRGPGGQVLIPPAPVPGPRPSPVPVSSRDPSLTDEQQQQQDIQQMGGP